MPFRRLFTRGSTSESVRLTQVLRRESVGGVLLLIAAVVALVWVNSPWSDSYLDLRDTTFGPESLHLQLSVGQWAADGLLAVFFFVVGLELKREFVAGDLRDPRRAVLPVVAAASGVAVPALLYLWVTAGSSGASTGWAIPTATDIAFAVAVLAVLGRHLPAPLRTFLLTLAVVDDLIAITIIAIFYTDELSVGMLLLALIPLAAFGLAVQRGPAWLRSWPVLVPLALATWALVHASGIHATVAGVLLAFTVPVSARRRPESETGRAPRRAMAERLEHALRPWSAGLAVPVFAFFSAGVAVGGLTGLVSAYEDPVTLGIVVGLVLGKIIGIVGATFLLSRFTAAELDSGLSWWDVLGMSALAGIGFTVSLLVGELAFGINSVAGDHAKIGVLSASLLAAVLASVILVPRNRHYRALQTTTADHPQG